MDSDLISPSLEHYPSRISSEGEEKGPSFDLRFLSKCQMVVLFDD